MIRQTAARPAMLSHGSAALGSTATGGERRDGVPPALDLNLKHAYHQEFTEVDRQIFVNGDVHGCSCSPICQRRGRGCRELRVAVGFGLGTEAGRQECAEVRQATDTGSSGYGEIP